MTLGRRARKLGNSSPGPSKFFQGKELLGLGLFIAIAMVGFPLAISQSRRFSGTNASDTPPKVVPDPRPIVADDSPPFQAIRDKTPSQFREVAAYAELLKRVRETKPGELAKMSRRDIFFTHLWERPARYRGVPVHLEGTLLKLLNYDANPELTEKKNLYEAWFITTESRPFPYVVVFEDPPAGLTIGSEMNEPIVVDGYFFKLLGYRAGDVPRAAPLLIGKVALPQSTAKATAGSGSTRTAEPSRWSNPAFVAVVALVGYVTIRLLFVVRKALRRKSLRESIAVTSAFRKPDRPEPPSEEDLTQFLANLETGEAGSKPDEPTG